MCRYRKCLCKYCIKECMKCLECRKSTEVCNKYIRFTQMSIFDDTETQNNGTPRHSLKYYGITKERYGQLTEYIQSGRYASLASQAAHTADNDVAEYILLSITKKLSYEGLEKLYGRGEIDRIPCSRTGFYYTKKYFYSLFDKELRRIGK